VFSFFSGVPPHEMKAPPLRSTKPQAMFGQTPKAVGGTPAPIIFDPIAPNLNKPAKATQFNLWA
jgi:hypothetical protein